MLDILWQSFSLFSNSYDITLEQLKKYNSKTLFKSGMTVSVFGMLALFFSDMLAKGNVSPHTAFFQLIGYYVLSYVCLSIAIFSLSLFYKKVNILQFVGLYLLLDLPYMIVLPLGLMAEIFVPLNVIVTIVKIGLSTFIFVLKTKLFMKYYNISFSQTLIVYMLPSLLLFIWSLMTMITVYNFMVA